MASVGKGVKVDNIVLRMSTMPVADKVAADEAGTAGDEEIGHNEEKYIRPVQVLRLVSLGDGKIERLAG